MRFVGLSLLCLLSYLIAMVVLFPAAPVVDYVKPQLGPVAIDGVNGKLYNGMVDRVRSTDDLLPVEFQNVSWQLAPGEIANGVGVKIGFDAYGGSGEGLVTRLWNSDIAVSDFAFDAQAKQFEPLLPVPIASFNGTVRGSFNEVLLVNELLKRIEGTLRWENAVLESPVPTGLGDVSVIIKPSGEQSHVMTLNAVGGDVLMDGTVTLTLSGDFAADVLFTPTGSASQAVRNGLRQMGRADAQGRVRLQRQGNVNRLM